MADRETLDVYAERAADYANRFVSEKPDDHLTQLEACDHHGDRPGDSEPSEKVQFNFVPRET